MKAGESYYRDEAGLLWLAETFVDEEGVTTTVVWREYWHRERWWDEPG